MARHKDSRSPSPAGSHTGKRRNDTRRDRDRRDGTRDRRRSRSPTEVSRRHRDAQEAPPRSNDRDEQRRNRDRESHRGDRSGRDQDSNRRRERSIDRSRDDGYGRGNNRDRRRSRDRGGARGGDRYRSPDNRSQRSRDLDREKDHRGRREDSRDRGTRRRDGTADSGPRRADDGRQRGASTVDDTGNREKEPAKSTQAQAQTEVDKKAERLRKIQAMKEKMAMKAAQEKDATAGSTKRLFAEMDQKANGTVTPSADSPAIESTAHASPTTVPGSPSPTPYAGKFDPKAIARNSKVNRPQSPTRLAGAKLGVVVQTGVPQTVVMSKSTPVKTLLSSNRVMSGFGFNKAASKPSSRLGPDTDKPVSKRKIDLDDEEISKRKLVKLPDASLETADDSPFVGQEDDQDDNEGADLDFAKDEEEIAASARAAQERREERILQQSMAMETDAAVATAEVPVEAEAKSEPEPEPEKMDLDEEVDPLDTFMAGLENNGQADKSKSFRKLGGPKQAGPEAYFSDDDDFRKAADDKDPASILAMAAKRKKKDIPTVDYSKLDLKPIRKNFWVEPYELKQMTEEEAVELRLELDGIKVSGKDIPKPVQKWSQCGLTQPILDAVERLGYEKPTPIQMQALPVIMSGRDVVGVAKTGSGKTMAFLLPMFRHIKDQDALADTDGPVALIMTPTRELAVQIHRDCKPMLKALNLRAVAAYGGAPIKDQIAELKRGAEIVVATPGRMIDLLAANQGRVTNLKRATYLVLDEADRMFDMGFEPQVMKIFNNVRPDRQTILFSATMPRIIDALTKKVLREPVEITVGGRSVVAPEIAQIIEIREETEKFVRLLELLGELYADDDDVRALIFVERQEKADELLRELLRRGYGCMSIHGGKDQADRDSTISDFKAGVCPILVATSIAARGLDVKQLKLVVNYDAPNHLEDYVHRAGRTGRAGNTGTAVTFVTEEQENCAPGIAKALEQSGQPVPERLNEMRKAFKEKVKSGKAKDTTGFGGKGLEKLDKEREAVRLLQRKTHKGEGEEEETKEEETKEDEKVQKAKEAIQSAVSKIVSRDAAKAEASTAKPDAAAAADGILAKPAASATSTATATAGVGGALDKASSVINEINARLARAGHLRPGQPVDNKGPDAGAFHATLEINDFPQKARWAVTNRTNVAKILDSTGTSITTKGNYYAAGKTVPTGAEPKLYILIEGDTEVQVGNALSELTRLLREGTIAAADAESRAPASGRYTIT